MTQPFNAGLVVGQDQTEVRVLLERWLDQPALRQLVASFGGDWPAQSSLVGRLQQLEKFSIVWDFRAGRERFEVETGHLFEPDQDLLIDEAARELGLIAPAWPSAVHYDYGVVLGGGATGCLRRTRLMATLMKRPGVNMGQVVVLGADRPVAPAEYEVAQTYAPAAQTEYELLCAAVEQAFHTPDWSVDSGPAGLIRHYAATDGAIISVMNAPSTDPNRRTNTADQYRFLIAQYDIHAGDTLLMATSQIYYPYHLFGAVAAVGITTGAAVEVVGYGPDETEARKTRSGRHLLQEIRSAIQAAAMLAERLP